MFDPRAVPLHHTYGYFRTNRSEYDCSDPIPSYDMKLQQRNSLGFAGNVPSINRICALTTRNLSFDFVLV